jgi:hypothetical protein
VTPLLLLALACAYIILPVAGRAGIERAEAIRGTLSPLTEPAYGYAFKSQHGTEIFHLTAANPSALGPQGPDLKEVGFVIANGAEYIYEERQEFNQQRLWKIAQNEHPGQIVSGHVFEGLGATRIILWRFRPTPVMRVRLMIDRDEKSLWFSLEDK